ncbi:MAG TPA: class I SAM-dependent RNA methyltransferase [Thermoanaerobaculia bacterium]|nr:class I SAM-dependent RNA methyltransferase [Thermoanaerobaculia bacterium]
MTERRGKGGRGRGANRPASARPPAGFERDRSRRQRVEESAGAIGPPKGARLATVDEVEVRIEKLVAGGEGFARFEGVPLFVPRSAPGDRLRVRVVERRPDYGRAEVLEVLEPGPGRREPPCPYFDRCGGCDLQHLEDSLQVELKAAAVVETLERLGGLRLPAVPEVVAGEPWGYRLRTQLHVEPPGRVVAAPGGPDRPAVGYFERGSHELVAVDRCPILVPELETLLPRLPAALGEADRLPRRLDLAAGEGRAVSAAPVVPGLPHGEVTATVAGFELAYDARSFFQTHRGLLERLVAVVLGPGGRAPDRAQEVAFDLYCGVGLFTLPLARRYRQVVGVEGDGVAVRFARRNARKNGVENVEIQAVRVESWITQMPERADRVVLDPPRTGLHPRVRETLLARAPPWITYVSCHPATLARDLRALSASYRLERLTLLDLFPQTGHMEAVAQLLRF